MDKEQGLSRRRCRTVRVGRMGRNRRGRVGHVLRNALAGKTHRLWNRKQPKEILRVPWQERSEKGAHERVTVDAEEEGGVLG